MISPVEYMSRLKMPAMVTDLRGNIVYENSAMKRLLSPKCRRRLFLSLVGTTGDKLAEDCRLGHGSIVTIDAGLNRPDMLVLSDGGIARWYYPKMLARISSISSPALCYPYIINYAGDAERDMMAEKPFTPAQLFCGAAYSAHIGYTPKRELEADEFCRFLSLSTFFLTGGNRLDSDPETGVRVILKSPEKAFAAASELIGRLLGSPLRVKWQAYATSRGFVLTDGREKLHAGGCSTVMTLRAATGPVVFSRRTAVTVASAVSAAEMGVFEGECPGYIR